MSPIPPYNPVLPIGQDDIDAAVAGLVDSAPGALNTLNELAAALGDDANFAATVTAALAEPKVFHSTHTFAIQGDVEDGTLPAFFSNIAADEVANIVGAHVRTLTGTATVNVRLNNGSVAGLEALAAADNSAYTAATTPGALADDYKVDVVISAATGATGLSVTVVVEHQI